MRSSEGSTFVEYLYERFYLGFYMTRLFILCIIQNTQLSDSLREKNRWSLASFKRIKENQKKLHRFNQMRGKRERVEYGDDEYGVLRCYMYF